MNVYARIAASLPNVPSIARELSRLQCELDEYAGLKLDVNDPALAREQGMIAALRAEYRSRTGEII